MRKKLRPVSNINVTPMVDVMLVLLIVFMVTAPLLTVGVPVNLPKVEANSLDAQKEPLEISINEENNILSYGSSSKNLYLILLEDL